MADIKQEIMNVKKQLMKCLEVQESQEKHNHHVNKQLELHMIVLEEGGVLARSEIKQGFKDLEDKHIELGNYCKTFYWTLLNLFGAYRSLSTGLITH